MIDRDTAARLGILPRRSTTRFTTRSASAKSPRCFTQLNQYHVILEVDPQFPAESRFAERYLCEIVERHASAARAHSRISNSTDYRACGKPSGTISRCDAFLQSGARMLRWATPWTRSRRPQQQINLPLSVHRELSGNGAGVSGSLANEPLLILAALITVYIVLGVLYESYIHPITILSTLPSAGVGAMLALLSLPARISA